MSNRTDFSQLARELQNQYCLSEAATLRIATELHNAYVAGHEDSPATVQSTDGGQNDRQK